MNAFKRAQAKRREQMAAEKAAAEASKKAAEVFVQTGFLPAGKWNASNGEAKVSIRDGFILDEVVESVSVATAVAQTIENLGGSAIVQRFETAIDVESGQEFFVTARKSFGGVIELPCKQSVWTDSKGYILPLKDVHMRMGLGFTHSHESVEAGSDELEEYELHLLSLEEVDHGTFTEPDMVELSYRPGFGFRQDNVRPQDSVWITSSDSSEEEKVSSPKKAHKRMWAYEKAMTTGARAFQKLLETRGEKLSPEAKAKLVEKHVIAEIWKDENKKAEAAEIAAEILAAKKEAPVVAPIVEDSSWESPVKVMTRKDRILAAKRRRANTAPAVPECPKKLAAKKLCEKTIVEAQTKLSEITAELKTLKHGVLIEEAFRGKETRIIKSDTKIQALKDAATHQRMIIREEREELDYLDGEMS